jgi:uncharacterized membrane protein
MEYGEKLSWLGRFLLVLVPQVAFCFTVIFDIPVARQFLGFFCLSFLPGFIAVKLLKLDGLGLLEKGLFSVGLSVAFLTFGGLVLNEFGLLLGISQPLSLVPLTVALTVCVLGGGLFAFKNERVSSWKIIQIKPLLPNLILALIPVVGIAGAVLVNLDGNNLVAMMTIIALCVIFAVVLMASKGAQVYPFAILMIALALLYGTLFVSRYMISFGSDVTGEFFVFRTTLNEGFWNSVPQPIWSSNIANLNSMLSVTILPSIYTILLKLDPTSVFALVFPALFALVPVGLYQTWRKYIGEKMSFVSAFLFMTYGVFFSEMLALNRQMIAELFLVLLLIATFHAKIERNAKIVLFMIFSSALITSHYSLAVIVAFFFVFVVVVLSTLLKRRSGKLTLSLVVLFLAIMFTWYIYTSNSSILTSLQNANQNISSQLGNFLNPTSRGNTVLTGLGLTQSPSIWNTVGRSFSYLTEIFIVIGLLVTILGKTEKKFEIDYYLLTLASGVLLVALLAVPGLANLLNMSRFYQILLIFLAPLFALGVHSIFKPLRNHRKEVVAILFLIVLVPYFLFNCGFIYEVTKTQSFGPSSLFLSKTRMSAPFLYGDIGYMDTYSVYGATWLSGSIDAKQSQVYADIVSIAGLLTVYGRMYSGTVNELSNVTTVDGNGVVYLSTMNVVHTTMAGANYWNSSDASFLSNLDAVYSNGGSQVYANPT